MIFAAFTIPFLIISNFFCSLLQYVPFFLSPEACKVKNKSINKCIIGRDNIKHIK